VTDGRPLGKDEGAKMANQVAAIADQRADRSV